jgi:hypothetical protein
MQSPSQFQENKKSEKLSNVYLNVLKDLMTLFDQA